jgi:hypothetical protein
MNRKVKLSLYLAAIFVAGVFTGIFISYQVVRHMMPNQERMASHWCADLQHKLDLTSDQAAKIRPIIDNALVGFKQNLEQDVLSRLSNCYAQVSLELTPAQKTKLDQLQQEQAKFLRSRFGDEAPRGGK